MEKKCQKKVKKNLGKEYTSISGKVVCEKKMRTGCSENCKASAMKVLTVRRETKYLNSSEVRVK